jgi:hypothetical protein
VRTSSLVLMVIGILLVVSLAAVAFYPSVHDFMASNSMWNGIRDFTSMSGAAPIDNLKDLQADPQKTVLVAIPYLPYNTDDLFRLKGFVESGNTLVLADDFGYGNDVLAYLGIEARFQHHLLLDPLFCYKNQYLPRITEFSPSLQEKNVTAIVFNHGVVLDNVGSSRAIAWSSTASFLDVNDNGSRDAGEPVGPFVVAAEYRLGPGTVKIVSDPSLILNSMVNQNDNYQFINYLAEKNGQPVVLQLDNSHLSQAPLDASKTTLVDFRNRLSNPFVLVGFIAIIFALAAFFALRREEIFGKY